MLVICAVKAHFNILQVGGDGMREVHRPKPLRSIPLTSRLLLSKGDFSLALLGQARTELWMVLKFKIIPEIF